MRRSLEHITITTGAARLSPRAEVDPETIARIRRSLGPSGGDLWAGWSVRRIGPAPAGTWVWDLLHDGRRIVACWLCAERRQSEMLWDLASRVGGIPGTRLHRPTGVPWLAAALVPPPAILSDPVVFADILHEAGDLERCVAWALLPD